MLVYLAAYLLTFTLSSLAEDTCRYEFTVPKPLEGCHGSKSIEDRLTKLEMVLATMAQESSNKKNSSSHDVAGLTRAVASVEEQQENLQVRLNTLSTAAAKEDQMKAAIQELNDAVDNITAKTEARLDQMTALIQKFFHSLSTVESSVNQQLQNTNDKLTEYLHELLDVKKQVADAELDTNSSRIQKLADDVDDVKESMYNIVGVNKARNEDRIRREDDAAATLKNHTEAISYLMNSFSAMVDHTHVMTDNVKAVSSEIQVLNNYARLKIKELEEQITMTGNDQPVIETVSVDALKSGDQKNITRTIQTSLEHFSDQLIQMMASVNRTAGEDGRTHAGHLEDTEEKAQYRELQQLHEEVQRIQKLYQTLSTRC